MISKLEEFWRKYYLLLKQRQQVGNDPANQGDGTMDETLDSTIEQAWEAMKTAIVAFGQTRYNAGVEAGKPVVIEPPAPIDPATPSDEPAAPAAPTEDQIQARIEEAKAAVKEAMEAQNAADKAKAAAYAQHADNLETKIIEVVNAAQTMLGVVTGAKAVVDESSEPGL